MITSSQTPSPGDIVSLTFDYLDRSGKKVRPAAVLSTRTFNANMGVFVFAPITGSAGSVDGYLEIQDLHSAGLNRRSYVAGYLFAAENSNIVRRSGSLSAPDIARLKELIRHILAL